MAVGEVIDRTYMDMDIGSSTWNQYDFDNTNDMYLYIMCMGFQFFAEQRYHIFADRNCWFYVYAWNGSGWTLLRTSPYIEENESFGIGVNANRTFEATYDYLEEYPSHLFRIRHRPDNKSYMDMWAEYKAVGYTRYDNYFKGDHLRMRPTTTYLYGWTTNGGLTPNNTSWMNTDNARGSILYDSLRKRFVIHAF